MSATPSPNPKPPPIAYLVNAYPKVSHSFIRREIFAHEAAGQPVLRVSVRPGGDVAEPEDHAEAQRTHVLLRRGLLGLLGTALRVKLRHPIRWARAAGQAIAMGRRRPHAVLRHLVYLMEAAALAELMRTHGATHLHAHFGTNPAAVARLCHTLTGLPYSFTVHGPEEFDAPLALSLPDKIADARFVAAISSFGRSQLFRWLPRAQWDRVIEVRCGLDPVFFAEGVVTPVPREEPESQTFVCVGRLCEQKGQLLLIDAFAEVRRRGHEASLVLVGDGDMRADVEAAVERHGLGGHVRFAGWASAEQVREHLRRARAMVLPSFAEGLPVVIMEALALGRPVITTSIAGIPELVDDACGWRVPAGDTAALVDALIDCLNVSPETVDAMGQAGAQRVRERHDAATQAARLRAAIHA